MSTSVEREVALDVERELAALTVNYPRVSELPIAPLRGVDDLIRLELALRLFAEIDRSERSNALIGAVRTILGVARAELGRYVR